MNPTEKLQKVLANLGFGSRRQLEQWIADGRVKVNGKVAVLGDRVDEKARLVVDGKPVRRPTTATKYEALMYHKPEGEVSTRSDEKNRRTVFESLPNPKRGRWIQVGRLDLNTSGLMLFTTDGHLANKLMHPSQELEREYAVRVLGEITPDMIKAMQAGVELEDGLAKFGSIREAGGTGANKWYHVTINEGRNREVRRLWESQGVTVSRLIRVRYGNVKLPRSLSKGKWDRVDVSLLWGMLDTSES